MRNIARISRRELIAHRPFDVGLTASAPVWKVVDSLGHKEFVVDVYFGPATGSAEGILKDVLVSPTAKHLVGDLRQPVRLERSKQGKYTVIGRAKIIPSGAQTPEGSILEPTYHEIKVNLADLGLLFIPDLDFQIGNYGEGAYGAGSFQPLKAYDAFGVQVMGDDVDPEDVPGALGMEPRRTTTTRHTLITIKPWGGIAEEGFVYGVGDYAGSYYKVLEQTE